jgi:hypothetical protein
MGTAAKAAETFCSALSLDLLTAVVQPAAHAASADNLSSATNTTQVDDQKPYRL